MNHNVKIPFYKIILVRHNEFEQFTLSEKLCWVQFAQSELLDTCHAATIPLGGKGVATGGETVGGETSGRGNTAWFWNVMFNLETMLFWWWGGWKCHMCIFDSIENYKLDSV